MSTFKVLVIDDDPALLELVRELLPPPAWIVVTASSPWEGLKLARTEQPNLILVDFQMPELDGPVTVERLKADPATRRIPVMAMTGMPGADVGKFVGAGCVGYLPKPFDVRSFPGVVSQLVRATAGRFLDAWPC